MLLGCRLSLSVFVASPVLLCYFFLVHQGDSVSNSGQDINVVHQPDKLSLHAGSEKRHGHIRMRRCKKTLFMRRKRFWFIAHCVFTTVKTSLVLLIVSWKIGMLGTRAGEAAVPGPAASTHMQPNEENHNLWVTLGGGRASLSEAHSDVPICVSTHSAIVQRTNVMSCD